MHDRHDRVREHRKLQVAIRLDCIRPHRHVHGCEGDLFFLEQLHAGALAHGLIKHRQALDALVLRAPRRVDRGREARTHALDLAQTRRHDRDSTGDLGRRRALDARRSVGRAGSVRCALLHGRCDLVQQRLGITADGGSHRGPELFLLRLRERRGGNGRPHCGGGRCRRLRNRNTRLHDDRSMTHRHQGDGKRGASDQQGDRQRAQIPGRAAEERRLARQPIEPRLQLMNECRAGHRPEAFEEGIVHGGGFHRATTSPAAPGSRDAGSC